ncbi:hypothetical protein AQ436_06575 [Arthrobacter sp. EpRS66]|nr:hypothetical protein AQ436_06575 [Arthrobacter sp. EpRS66]
MSETVATPSPISRDDLAEFLTLQNWQIKGSGNVGDLWEAKSGQRVGVPYGINSDSVEWASVIERVAKYSEKSSQQISDGIRGLWMDTFEFRAASDIYIKDTIPASAGADLFQNVWRILRSSATTSQGRKAQISGAWSRPGEASIENARFAHTRPGSYILPLLVPLPRPVKKSTNQDSLDLGIQQSFHESNARRATRTMVESMAAVDAGLIQPEAEPNNSIVSDLVSIGVSRELITAIYDVVKHQSVANLDMNVAWATSAPGPSSAPKKIVIPSDAAPRLAKVAKLFVHQRKSKSELLTGPIFRLSDRADEPFGVATLEVPRSGRLSKIDIYVPRAKLKDAHDWFKEHETVVAEGVVESTPAGLIMRSPTRIQDLGSTMLFK